MELVSMSHDDHSTQIRLCIERLQAGDEAARDELLYHSCDRLRRLSRKMLRGFPGVHRWEQTDDVLQNAAVRLCRALREVRPPTAADFFRLAAAEVRRELLDLARRHAGAHGLGAHHESRAAPTHDAGDAPAAEFQPVDTTNDPDRLAAWTEFHRAAEALPPEAREIFDLLYYQGISQLEAAAILGVSERTVKRRWQSARLQLHLALEGRMPGL
jgi:RNA polymerase sigma-70 factor (ECF subfamily)